MLLPITPSDHVIKYDTVIADGKSAANGWSWQAEGGWRKKQEAVGNACLFVIFLKDFTAVYATITQYI